MIIRVTADASWIESMPERYDTCLGPALFAPYAEHLAQRAARWAPSRVLEVAAGSGIVTRALIDSLPAARITATDLNPSMVEWARRHHAGATWQVADAQDLAFDPATFDLVVCGFGAMFFPDRASAYAQMRAALTDGGRALLSIWDTVEGSTLPAAVVDCLRELFPNAPDPFIVRVPHGYHDPDQISADLQKGGFASVDVERVVLHGAPTDPAVLVEGICRGTPMRFELQQWGDADEITRQLQDLVVARLGREPVVGALAAFVVTAQ